MDDKRFGRALLLIITVVGILGLMTSGSLDGITGAATRKVLPDDNLILLEQAKQACEDARSTLENECTEIITGVGVLRPVGANCAQVKNEVALACGTYEKRLKSFAVERSLRGTLTGAAVALDGDSPDSIASIPWSLVLVGGLVLFLYYQRYQRRRTR